MSILADITGNVLVSPTQRIVSTARGSIRITEIRMMSDVWKQGEHEGELVQDAQRTRPVNLTIWNERLGQTVMEVIRAGMRVNVRGDLYVEEWEKKTDGGDVEPKFGLKCDVASITLALNRVKDINMKPKSDMQRTKPPTNADSAVAGPADDDIPF